MLSTLPKKVLWFAAFGAVVLFGSRVVTNLGNKAAKA